MQMAAWVHQEEIPGPAGNSYYSMFYFLSSPSLHLYE